MNWLATGGHAVLSLYSGYGGLELALQRVLPTSYVGAYCENYGPAQQVLQAHNPRVDVFKDVRDPELLNLKAPIASRSASRARTCPSQGTEPGWTGSAAACSIRAWPWSVPSSTTPVSRPPG